MRSGNGRHRRPRQAPALFVTAGVAGAGIAMPLLGAGSAHAADTATWDRVAQCESGGVWSGASGDGYGGLRLTADLWQEYGGLAYAPRPDMASRAQQIAVAEKILDDRGPGAWPSCAADAGLSRGGRAPDVDPGSTDAPAPAPTDHDDQGTGGTDDATDPADTPGSHASPSPSDPSHPSDTADPSDAPDPSGTSGSHDPAPDPSDATPEPGAPDPGHAEGDGSGHDGEGKGKDGSGEHGTPGTGGSDASDGSGDSATPGSGSPDPTPPGKHRGGEGADDGGRSSGRHASRGGGERPQPARGDYTVRPGDSLSAIAEARELPGGWPALYERNREVVGSDADLIHPGQRLDLGR
ncbi:transglycosylase family protein [Streptomyces sp. NPDC050161]|uniref:transglycosylase family protein n=1 Tax=Streptomyces sp. NPDC050161 TaxID=3365604 RepID=UPI0037A59616